MSLGVSPIRTDASLTDRTVIAVREVMAGRRRGLRAILPFAGPAMIASVAYIDPGNFATNIQAGARYGYALLWVVLLANLVAMLFQSMSAKIGIVTNRNLAELCREHFPPAHGPGDVGGERNRGDGDGFGRVSRRGHWVVAAVSFATAGRHGRDGDRSLTGSFCWIAPGFGRWSW